MYGAAGSLISGASRLLTEVAEHLLSRERDRVARGGLRFHYSQGVEVVYTARFEEGGSGGGERRYILLYAVRTTRSRRSINKARGRLKT